jgi:hypothetical protein
MIELTEWICTNFDASTSREWLETNEGSAAAREQAAEWIARFSQHLTEAGLGQVSEIADAEPPHKPARLLCPSLERG